MEIVVSRVAGIDVHKRFVTVCRVLPGADGGVVKEFKTVETMTDTLLGLGDWLSEGGVTHVVMESTGVYWKPLWNLWEEQFTLVLANAQHVKTVPGRKSDIGDAEWLAELLRHGLVRGSVVPDRPQRELRELTRYRLALSRERAAEVNRLQKTLEGANIKLASVVSDVTGVSARRILGELITGNDDAAAMAQHARGALRAKLPRLERAVQGRMSAHQRFMLTQHLLRIDGMDEQIAAVSGEIATRLVPFTAELDRLDTIPGIGRWSAEVILAEIGTDLTRFATAGHLSSWAGMCPGMDETGGKRRSSRIRHGSPTLRVTLTEAAYAAGRSKHSLLGDQYRRLIARRGKKRTAIAIGRRILELCYLVLTTGESYDDEVAREHAARPRMDETTLLVRRLEKLGHTVMLHPAA